MYVNKKALGSVLAGVLTSVVLAAGTAHARDEAPGYTGDSGGNIVRSGSGDCVRTGSWKPGMATIVGCDGVVLDAPVEITKGAPSGVAVLINVPAAALFAFDKADLTEEGKQAIEEQRKDVRPELAKAFEVIVVGHTDNTGSAEYNMGLSKRRAEAVRDYLANTGVPADILRVLGRGKNAPLASNNTEEGRALNRRVEIYVIGELRALDSMLFPSVALFPRRSAELTEQGKQLVEKHRGDARIQLRRAVYVEIIGHTDDVGDDDYNQELSEQRAQAMTDYLVSTGLDASMIVSRGAGESMPIASNRTDEGRAENRRVEILVLGRLEE